MERNFAVLKEGAFQPSKNMFYTQLLWVYRNPNPEVDTSGCLRSIRLYFNVAVQYITPVAPVLNIL
jgi:hypothetical protein